MPTKKVRKVLLCFLIPALLFYVIFWVTPVLMSFYYGVTNWKGVGDYDFVGLKNYKFLIKQGTLSNALFNTIKYTLFVVIWGNLQALTLAMILNMKIKAKGAFRTIFYIPALFSTIVIAFIWSYVYAPYDGLLSEIGRLFGSGYVSNLLGEKATSLSSTSQQTPWQTGMSLSLQEDWIHNLSLMLPI